MLKIKDNVDLKDLEKFGFEYDEMRCFGKPAFICKNELIGVNIFENIQKGICNIKEKEFLSFSFDFNESLLELIYDLTKADLIEKVDEFNER